MAHQISSEISCFNLPEVCSKENTGRWTPEEHELFLQGLQLYNKQWKSIADLIQTRTVVQIRTHAQKYFQKLLKSKGDSKAAFDLDDDATQAPLNSAKLATEWTGVGRMKRSCSDMTSSSEQSEDDRCSKSPPRNPTRMTFLINEPVDESSSKLSIDPSCGGGVSDAVATKFRPSMEDWKSRGNDGAEAKKLVVTIGVPGALPIVRKPCKAKGGAGSGRIPRENPARSPKLKVSKNGLKVRQRAESSLTDSESVRGDDNLHLLPQNFSDGYHADITSLDRGGCDFFLDELSGVTLHDHDEFGNSESFWEHVASEPASFSFHHQTIGLGKYDWLEACSYSRNESRSTELSESVQTSDESVTTCSSDDEMQPSADKKQQQHTFLKCSEDSIARATTNMTMGFMSCSFPEALLFQSVGEERSSCHEEIDAVARMHDEEMTEVLLSMANEDEESDQSSSSLLSGDFRRPRDHAAQHHGEGLFVMDGYFTDLLSEDADMAADILNVLY